MQVYIHSMTAGETRDALKNLLQEIDCEIVDDIADIDMPSAMEPPPPSGEGPENPNEDEDESDEEPLGSVCLVVLTPGLTAVDLEPGLTQAIRQGCRVIGIWAAGAAGDASALEDHGSDTVPWDLERIRAAIFGKPQHLDNEGDEMPDPPRTHGGC